MAHAKSGDLKAELDGYRVYEIATLLLFILPVFAVFAFKLPQKVLYAQILFGHAAALVVAVVRLVRKKMGFHLDVEIALVLTVTDLVTRFFLPVVVSQINNIIIFLACLVFLYRQTKLPILRNGLFLSLYTLAYFSLNYKMLDFAREGFVGILFSIVLSIYFAFTLLAASKVKNLYRATFCAGMALLTVIVLFKRYYVHLYNPAIIIQSVDTCLMAFCFIHWFNGRRDAAVVFGKTFFNVGMLPNSILFASVIAYCFFPEIISPLWAIYGLVLVVFCWFMIFSIKGFWPVFKRNNSRVPLRLEIAYCLRSKVYLMNYLKHITN